MHIIGYVDRNMGWRMFDALTLDQIRTFIAAAEEGSFSAAARKMRRAQSVVSEVVRALEGQVGVPLFDRSSRSPRLTAEGMLLLTEARAVIGSVDNFKGRASGMASGLETRLTIIIDVFFPIDVLIDAAEVFREKFPSIPLRVFSEPYANVYQSVIDNGASFGIAGSRPNLPHFLSPEKLHDLKIILVAAPEHPLAELSAPISADSFRGHTQLVLQDSYESSAGHEFGVPPTMIWRMPTLSAKRSFLLKGLGWGGVPLHDVSDDLSAGRLVELRIEGAPAGGLAVPMSIIYPTGSPPGRAGRWLIDRIKAGQAPYNGSA